MNLTKTIIDYAEQDEGSEMRDALYASIQQRVMDHLDAHKQRLAQSLIAQEDATEEDENI